MRKPFERNHVSDAERVNIGLLVYYNKGIYGFVTGLARKYLVSRWFIYYCYLQFLVLVTDVKSDESPSLRPESAICQNDEEYILSIYLNNESFLSGIKRTLKETHGIDVSDSEISRIINKYGGFLEDTEKVVVFRLTFTLDEIFINGRPILVTVDAFSGYILGIRLADRRDSDTWEEFILEIVDPETGQVERIIADQGKGIVAMIEALFPEGIYQSDLYHVVVFLSHWIGVLLRKAYSAIKKEYDAESNFEKAKDDKIETLFEAYGKAYENAQKWIYYYDSVAYLFSELQKVLMIADMETGRLRSKDEAKTVIEIILDLIEAEIDYEKVQKGVRSFRRALKTVLGYFDQVEEADAKLKAAIEDADVRQILILIYMYQQKLHTALGQWRRHLKGQIEYWRSGLIEWFGEAEFKRLFEIVDKELSPILRTSSMIENTNSRLRRFFDSARGQINQNRLNLIRFYLNHKVFERGVREGKSPIQLFYNQSEPEHWLVALRRKKAEAEANVKIAKA